MAADFRWRCAALLLCAALVCILATNGDEKPQKKKKDIRDYNDADMARLLEQWEEDDDIEEGDLPEHKRSPPSIDLSKMDASKPEDLLKMSKKGRTLMVFATVSGNPTEKETEELTGLWQGSLFNANYDIQRTVTSSGQYSSPDSPVYLMPHNPMRHQVSSGIFNHFHLKDLINNGVGMDLWAGPSVMASCDESIKKREEERSRCRTVYF
ncbi:LRP chaperone MESD isoform X2 [Solea solea]|uniref:LRP chaperone MESD isoform X2 n=1 Tax=Solea solea TaxID=90069 RepID=UPI00272AA855|nr:LRP chaperone MESD isoform X2 [Solea solea]